jgi:hypothetical protein
MPGASEESWEIPKSTRPAATASITRRSTSRSISICTAGCSRRNGASAGSTTGGTSDDSPAMRTIPR